jgi:hypothetical protein
VIPLSSLEATAPVIAPDCNAPSREIEGLSGRNSNESRESLPGSTLIEGMVASASCFDVAGRPACPAACRKGRRAPRSSPLPAQARRRVLAHLGRVDARHLAARSGNRIVGAGAAS